MNLEIKKHWKLIFLAAGGASLIVCAVVLALIYPNFQTEKKLTGGVIINKVGNAAFGHLVSLTGSLTGQESAPQATSLGRDASSNREESSIAAPVVPVEFSVGMNVGGGVAANDGESTGSTGKTSSSAMIYRPAVYKYVYRGGEIKLPDEQIDVLRRIKDAGQNFSSEIFQNMATGLLNISKFQNLKVRYLNIFEDADRGYEISVNPSDGSASINMNWDKWREAMSCPATGCAELSALSDEEILSIANQFLSDYGIDTAIYGKPEVDNNWKIFYERPENKVSINIPQQISVVYPLSINDKVVYEQWGNPSGMTVTVDIRIKRAASAYGISTQNYQSSAYEVEKSPERIIKFAEMGGLNEYSYAGSEAEIKEIELGDPQLGYTKQWNYKDTGESEELIVPALVFPITKMPDSAEMYYYGTRQNIVIPIVKEILDQAEETQNTIGTKTPPDIRPLTEPAMPPSPDILPTEDEAREE